MNNFCSKANGHSAVQKKTSFTDYILCSQDLITWAHLETVNKIRPRRRVCVAVLRKLNTTYNTRHFCIEQWPPQAKKSPYVPPLSGRQELRCSSQNIGYFKVPGIQDIFYIHVENGHDRIPRVESWKEWRLTTKTYRQTWIWEISFFRRSVKEFFALLGCYGRRAYVVDKRW